MRTQMVQGWGATEKIPPCFLTSLAVATPLVQSSGVGAKPL